MKEKLLNILYSRGFAHILFWLIAISVLLILYYDSGDPFRSTVSFIVIILCLAVLIYFNILFLIPRFLSKKRIILYGLFLILATLLIAPIRTLLNYYIYTGHYQIQQEIIDSHWAIFTAMLVITIGSTIGKIVLDWFQKERELRIMENETMQSELRFLRAQINPHFLFNTLNSLYALTLKKSDRAPNIVIKLSEIMRYMLYECNDKKVALQKEIDYIRNYLDLERLRHKNQVRIDLDIKGNVEGQKIAPLLFSPFLENAFKHGLNKHMSEGYIKVRLTVNGNDLTFNIENSKPPGDVEEEKNDDTRISGGIGLKNVRRRLELLYPGAHNLTIKETEASYAIYLSISLNNLQ